MIDDIPETMEDRDISEQILIEELQERIQECTYRLQNKIDVKGNPLTQT